MWAAGLDLRTVLRPEPRILPRWRADPRWLPGLGAGRAFRSAVLQWMLVSVSEVRDRTSHFNSVAFFIPALAFLIAISGVPAASQPIRIDPSKGNVNGRRGYAAWPEINGAASDPTGYELV